MNILTSIAKSLIAAAATPVAVLADVLTLPASSMDPHRGPFERTAAVLRTVGENFNAAVKPDA
jgi:hypothetical protein